MSGQGLGNGKISRAPTPVAKPGPGRDLPPMLERGARSATAVTPRHGREPQCIARHPTKAKTDSRFGTDSLPLRKTPLGACQKIRHERWRRNLGLALGEEPALISEAIAPQRSSDETTKKERYGGIQGEGGAGRAQGRQDPGGAVGEV